MPDNINNCRVCGYWNEDPPWGEDGESSTFDICVCCGVEAGYEDSNRQSVLRYREIWLRDGAVWFDATERPANWSLSEQMKHIPPAFK